MSGFSKSQTSESKSCRHVLTPEDAALFAAAYASPLKPTERAASAARAFKAKVVYFD